MKKSEKILAIVTAVGAVLFVYFNFFAGDVDTGPAVESGNLEAEQSRFEQYARTLKDGKRIQDEYERLTLRNVPETRGSERPGNTFQVELARILTDEFNQPSPRIEPYQMSVIPKVEDYYFVDVSVTIDDKVASLIQLLLRMEKRGLLIKEFTLDVRGPGWRGDATLNAKVSRLVQHDEFSRRALKLRRGSIR
jgi:hypothetical protein